MIKQFFLAVLAAVILPSAALAQDVPSYAEQPPAYATTDSQIHGRVIGFDGGYNLTVRDDQGLIDHVLLHQGTIINPTGLTLAPGMVVSIDGFNGGSYFGANEIDTPYTFYPAYGWYGYYGHPWYYYGPSHYGVSFFFGVGGGWWHANYWHGGYHVYNSYRSAPTNGPHYAQPHVYEQRTTVTHTVVSHSSGGYHHHY